MNWLATAKAGHKEGSPRLSALRWCAKFGGLPQDPAEIKPHHGSSLKACLGVLAPATQRAYYRIVRRALKAQGVDVSDWPTSPQIPRTRKREPFPDARLEEALRHLRNKYQHTTANLCHILRHTGMRVQKEALHSPLRVTRHGGYAVLEVECGKGGHWRSIPVWDEWALDMLTSPATIERIREVPYATHLSRWKGAVEALRIDTKLPTLHSLRHAYATEVYRRTGDIALAQQLLGHVDPKTTSRYIGERGHEEIIAKMRSAGGDTQVPQRGLA